MKVDNLSTLRIEVEPKLLESLETDIWQEELIPAKLTVDTHSYDMGITYRGHHTRKFPKKSYRIDFGSVNEDFRARELHLNAEYCDPSLIRNRLSFEFFKKLGCMAPESNFVFIEVNGKPSGIYLQLESVDELFLQNRKLSHGPIYYATNHQTNFSLLTTKGKLKKSLISGYNRKVGNDEDDLDLEEFIAKINSIPRHEFKREIVKYVDVKKYLNWLCGVICTQNYDAFIQNYALYRNGQTGLYEMIPWDFDATFGRNWNGDVMKYDRVPIEGYNTLTARILDVYDFRVQYQLLLEEVINTYFTTSELEPTILNLHHQLRPYLAKDPYKKDTVTLFDQEPEYIIQFIKNRSDYISNNLNNLI
ncbi:CotH kinase family protein [Bacillus pinisoli]|uniref:CotH kinase family protein n=1 Tax=Bacillus pinisoli TaxID=2901866 RepID=UPI001FF39DCF|nr:CotH kinase family protein [Bacillus pinisoli]